MDRETAFRRVAVRRQVTSCTRCGLHRVCRSPVPFRGPTPARICVLGEAPGAVEDKEGIPFCGPAGQLLAELLARVGIDPTKCAYVNTISCYPARTRTPNKAEVAACRDNMLAQMDLVDPRYVLVLGSTALSAWRPDLKISKVHGRPFWVGGMDHDRDAVIFWPTYHPAAILHQPGYLKPVEEDLGMFKVLIEVDDLFEVWPEDCVMCSKDVYEYDENGIGYCSEHRKWIKRPAGAGAIGR